MKIKLADILELSLDERLELVTAIWDSIAEVPAAVSLSDEQRRMLDERLDDLAKHPNAGSPWPEVKARILSSK